MQLSHISWLWQETGATNHTMEGRNATNLDSSWRSGGKPLLEHHWHGLLQMQTLISWNAAAGKYFPFVP